MADFGEKLLKRFAAQGDERAFREFVERYVGMVEQVALRQTGSRSLAEEVSQNVFCAVLKKKDQLFRHPERIPGWLHRASLFESKTIMRKEQSFQRRKRLQHPDSIEETSDAGGTAWLMALPHLDKALDHLSESDRRVVLQHYFQGLSFAQIGKQQSRPAGTVQKQCRRALDKLARLLKKRGVAVSVTVLSAGLCPQLAEASSPVVAKTVSSQALAEGANYSSANLSLHLALNSKSLITTIAVVVLVPLLWQQAALTKDWNENRKLRKELVILRAEASRPDSKSQPRPVSRQRISSGEMTLDRLRYALEQGERRGRMKFLEFEEMVASLSVQDLRRLTPEALALPRRRGRQNLCEYLIAAMGLRDPEGTVRLVTEFSQKYPVVTNLGVEQALARWTDEEPDRVVDWLLELRPQVSEQGWQEHGLLSYQGVALSVLIEEGSERIREVLVLNPKYHASYVIRESLDDVREEFRQSNTLVEQAQRFEAFLPWIREFGKEGNRGVGTKKTNLLQSLLDRFPGESRSDLVELLLTRKNLLPEERGLVVRDQGKWYLEQHFRTSGRTAWDGAVERAYDFLNGYEGEQAESYFEEARAAVLEREHRLAESRISRLEQQHEAMRDSDLRRELMDYRFFHFPDLLERGIEISREIKNPEERKKVTDFLQEPLQLAEEES